MLGRERAAVVLEGDERLAVEDVLERQVRRVPAIRPGDREGGGGIEIDVLEQGIDADAAPAHVELRPLRHAADVDRPLPARERQERLPGPADRLADEALDRERPAVERRAWCRSGRQHREVRRQVLTGRDTRRDIGLPRALAAAPTHEPPGHETVRHGASGAITRVAEEIEGWTDPSAQETVDRLDCQSMSGSCWCRLDAAEPHLSRRHTTVIDRSWRRHGASAPSSQRPTPVGQYGRRTRDASR